MSGQYDEWLRQKILILTIFMTKSRLSDGLLEITFSHKEIPVSENGLFNCCTLKGYQPLVGQLELRQEYYACMPRTKPVFVVMGVALA